MTRFRSILLVTTLGVAVAAPSSGWSGDRSMAAAAYASVPSEEGDPGQGLYKNGYNQILAEQWVKARATFADLLKRFPKSTYADDARYWSAYALMHLDRNKALQEYRTFINRHPKSAYLSDAIADLGNVERDIETERIQRRVEDVARHHTGNDSLMRVNERLYKEAQRLAIANSNLDRFPQAGMTPDSAFGPGHPMAWAKAWSLGGSDIRGFAMNMKRLRWKLQRGFGAASTGEIDRGTQLRLEALSAIGHGEEDERGFSTLKGVALDRSQPTVLRIEAMDQLAEFTKHDPSPVFLDIARTDSSEEIQSESLDHLRECIKDKDKSVQTLATLYRAIPAANNSQRSMILYEVADIGNDPAVDFLSGVAKGDSSYDLRSEAVYYLGNIGGEKARAVLYDVLLNK